MKLTESVIQTIRKQNKAELRKAFKRLTQWEYKECRELWLDCTTFEEFVKKLQSNDVPLPSQDCYSLSVFYERYHCGSDSHKLED